MAAHRLAHLQWASAEPIGRKLNAVLWKQHDHGGAQQEAAHFLTFLQLYILSVVTPLAHDARAWWVDLTVPNRGHAANDGGANEHQHHGALCSFKLTQ